MITASAGEAGCTPAI